MDKVISIEQWQALTPENQALYYLDGDEYRLVEEDRTPLLLLLLVRWDGRRYVTPDGTILTPAMLRNRAKFISKEIGIELARSFNQAVATNNARFISEWFRVNNLRLLRLHRAFFEAPLSGALDARTRRLASETLRRHLQKHATFFARLQQDVLTGKIPAAQLTKMSNRISMYGRAVYHGYIEGDAVLQVILGNTEERRILDPLAQHCLKENAPKSDRPECPELASRGWQPIGTLPEVGDCICLTSCRCHFEYRGAE